MVSVEPWPLTKTSPAFQCSHFPALLLVISIVSHLGQGFVSHSSQRDGLILQACDTYQWRSVLRTPSIGTLVTAQTIANGYLLLSQNALWQPFHTPECLAAGRTEPRYPFRPEKASRESAWKPCGQLSWHRK